MQPTYADIAMMPRVEGGRWPDRAPRMPLIGFVLGTGLSLVLWAVIGWSAWVLFT